MRCKSFFDLVDTCLLAYHNVVLQECAQLRALSPIVVVKMYIVKGTPVRHY